MNRDKITRKVGAWLMLPLLLAGCSGGEEEYVPGVPETGSLSFEVRTRSAENAVVPDDNKQYTRLFVAERLQEHEWDNLHCGLEHRYTLKEGNYKLEGLYGQWYKFAFLCVPKWTNEGGEKLFTEEKPVEKTCDYNKLMIDFKPVLAWQKNTDNRNEGRDLNIYRRVIDRWIDPEGENIEDVVMTRITGELLLDMGIPADQFPKDIRAITLTVERPAMKVYVRDEATDEVITAGEGDGDMEYRLDFSQLSDAAYRAAMKTRQTFRLCLLPGVLKGGVTVQYKGTNEAVYLPIGEETDKGETHVEIRKNRVTTVLYNGMQKNEFEVRYAGFDTGDDAVVDVDDDEWDGWQ